MARRSVSWIWLLVAALALGAALASCAKKKEEAPAPPAGNVTIQNAQLAPAVTLRAPDGTTKTFDDYKGKIVFINFFATWNVDSKQQIPALNNLAANYARYDVVVLGIAIDTASPSALTSFMSINPVKYPVFWNGSEIVPKFGGVRKLPATVVLTRAGVVYKRVLGVQTERSFESLIREIMGQRL